MLYDNFEKIIEHHQRIIEYHQREFIEYFHRGIMRLKKLKNSSKFPQKAKELRLEMKNSRESFLKIGMPNWILNADSVKRATDIPLFNLEVERFEKLPFGEYHERNKIGENN